MSTPNREFSEVNPPRPSTNSVGGGDFMAEVDLTAPLEKKIDSSFGLAIARQFQARHLAQYTNVGGVQNNRLAVNYQYALGNQAYRSSIAPIDTMTGNDQQTIPGSDQTNMQLLPQVVRTLVGKLQRVKLKPSITMVDSLSQKDRGEYKARLAYLMSMAQQGAEIQPILEQFGFTEEDVPLEIKAGMMPQFTTEMNLEMALTDISNQSGMEVVTRHSDTDLVIAGTSGYYINRNLNRRQIEYINPLNAGHSPSFYEDGRDIWWSYRIRMVSVEDVRYMAQGQVDEEKLKNLRGGMFNLFFNSIFFWNVDQFGLSTMGLNAVFSNYVLLMDFEFYTTDTHYTNIRNGKQYYGFKPKDGDPDVVRRADVQNLIGGSYVCGTDVIFDYGIKDRISQPLVTNKKDAAKVNAAKVYGSFLWTTPNMIQGLTKSFIDVARPHIDAAEDTFKKIKTYTREFIPWLVVIDQKALAEIITKDGGDPISADDFLTTAIQKGQIIGDSSNLQGLFQSSFGDAFKIVGNEGAANLQMLWTMLLQQLNLIRDTLGIVNVESGMAPTADQGKGLTQLALAGSDNILSGLVSAKVDLIERLWENLMYDILINGASGVVEGRPFDVLSGNPEREGDLDGEYITTRLIPNLQAEVLPTDEMWQKLYAIADTAMQAKTITMSDYVYLQWIDNLKQAQAYLAIKERRGEIRAAKAKQADIEANAMQQQASNEQAQKGKENLEKLKTVGAIMEKWAEKVLEKESPDVALPKIQRELALIYGE
jgi:hypothetical protein